MEHGRTTFRGRSLLAALLLLLLPGMLRAQTNEQKCGAARDLMVRALEKIGPGSSDAAISDANYSMRTATRMCAELADAWYYRHLFGQRLHDLRDAQVTLDQATNLQSEALREQLDPLHLAAPPTPTAPLPKGPGDRWALVIGIGTFADTNIPALPHSADDANLFSATLLDPAVAGFPSGHVRTLLDREATYVNIRAGLNWIARSAKPEDLVVIYVATHGSARSKDTVAGASYLLTSDTKVGPDIDEDLLFGSALAMNDLVATVANRISARRTAIFIDTCYSGSAAASGHGDSVSERDLRRFNEGAGRIVVSAARSDQESRESKQLGHGYFTWYLVEALKAPGGPHRLSEVYDNIAKQVPARVAADAKPMHVEQNPVISRSTPDTDFTLSPGGQ